MNQDQDEKLETEVAAFFARAERREGTYDFQEAALRTFDRN
jgi:hypothetical protein